MSIVGQIARVVLDHDLIQRNKWLNDQERGRSRSGDWPWLLLVYDLGLSSTSFEYHSDHFTYQNIIEQWPLVFGFAVIAFPTFHIAYPVSCIRSATGGHKKCHFSKKLLSGITSKQVESGGIISWWGESVHQGQRVTCVACRKIRKKLREEERRKDEEKEGGLAIGVETTLEITMYHSWLD